MGSRRSRKDSLRNGGVTEKKRRNGRTLLLESEERQKKNVSKKHRNRSMKRKILRSTHTGTKTDIRANHYLVGTMTK